MSHYEAHREGSSFVPGLILGLAIGGALGLLFAPRPGRETMGMVMDKAKDLSGRIPGWVEEARGVVESATARVKSRADGRETV